MIMPKVKVINTHLGKLENSSFKSHIVLPVVQGSTQHLGIQPLNLSYVKVKMPLRKQAHLCYASKCR